VREQRLVFGEVARDYDEVRAECPRELVDAVFAYAGRVPGHIVEVGAGTGKATAAFAGRGAAITCVEPDPAMARVLRDRFPAPDHGPGVGTVRVVGCGFEEFEPRPAGVPLIVCADAWHWVPAEVRLAKAHQLLSADGVLALISRQYGVADPELEHALERAYARHAPRLLAEGVRPVATLGEHWLAGELSGCPFFTDVRAVGFEFRLRYPTARYRTLLSTFSPHRMLPEAERAVLLDAIAAAVDAHGGVVEQRVSTTLVLGRRAG
jgi:SAM-dependent methyltransferase